MYMEIFYWNKFRNYGSSAVVLYVYWYYIENYEKIKEEITLRNFNGKTFTFIGTSQSMIRHHKERWSNSNDQTFFYTSIIFFKKNQNKPKLHHNFMYGRVYKIVCEYMKIYCLLLDTEIFFSRHKLHYI